MKYRFRATRAFWRSFERLSAQQQSHARKAFAIFKQNPFGPRVRSHKIQKLSARYARAIYAAEIEADLRVVFYIEGNTVVTWTSARTICIADSLISGRANSDVCITKFATARTRALPGTQIAILLNFFTHSV